MKKVLLLVENGFEDRELLYPYYRFQEAGYKVDVVEHILSYEIVLSCETSETKG